MYRQRPYLVCTVYVLWCTYGYAYMYTVLPNVYLYYYICCHTTDVTTLVVSLTDSILQHQGNSRRKTQMRFLVKWTDFDDSHNTWESLKNLYRRSSHTFTPSRHVENNSDRKVSSQGTTYTLSFEDSSSFLQRYVVFQEV